MVGASTNITGTVLQKMPQASDQIDTTRRNTSDDPAATQTNTGKNSVQASELLKQIKALTENGTFSVQFETDSDTGKMVVKVVDTKTDEVIRQIPPEALLGLDQALTEYATGNFVNTKS